MTSKTYELIPKFSLPLIWKEAKICRKWVLMAAILKMSFWWPTHAQITCVLLLIERGGEIFFFFNQVCKLWHFLHILNDFSRIYKTNKGKAEGTHSDKTTGLDSNSHQFWKNWRIVKKITQQAKRVYVKRTKPRILKITTIHSLSV